MTLNRAEWYRYEVLTENGECLGDTLRLDWRESVGPFDVSFINVFVDSQEKCSPLLSNPSIPSRFLLRGYFTF